MLETTPQSQQREALLNSIFDNAPLGITLATVAGDYVKANKAYIAMSGYSETEILHDNLSSHSSREDWVNHEALRKQLINGELAQFFIVKKIIRKDRSWFWSRHTVASVLSASGAVSHTVAMVEDITEEYLSKKKIELLNERSLALVKLGFEALQEKPIQSLLEYCCRHLKKHLKANNIGIFYKDSKTEKLTINTGLGVFSQIGDDSQLIVDLVAKLSTHTHTRNKLDAINSIRLLSAVLDNNPERYEIKSIKKNSSAIFIGLSTPKEQLGYIVIIYQKPEDFEAEDQQFLRSTANILNAKIELILHTKALSENRTLLQQAQNLAGFAHWQYDVLTDKSVWSDNLPLVLGVTDIEQFNGLQKGLQVLVPEDRVRVEKIFLDTFEHGGSQEFICRTISTDGKIKTLQLNCLGVKNESEQVRNIIGTCVDISEKQHKEQQLKDYNASLKQLSKKLVDAQESERKRISLDLHDQVGQNLTALGLSLSVLEQSLPNASPAVVNQLADTRAILDATTLSIEHLLNDIRPPMLEDWSLRTALEWYVRNFQARYAIEVVVRDTGSPTRFPADKETAIYRAAQEALNNVVKHSRATVVEIHLEWDNDRILFGLVDNGLGFNLENKIPGQGFGMTSMKERIEAIGGTFRIESAVGKGTRIDFAIEKLA